jgi:hypothetical protein
VIKLWHGFGPETKGALIGAVTTVVIALVGFGGLILQMRSQGRQQREAIAENERRKLKAAMYDDAVAVSRSLADAAIELSTQLRTMAMQVSVVARAESVNFGYQTPTARFPAIASGYDAFGGKLGTVYIFRKNREPLSRSGANRETIYCPHFSRGSAEELR